MFTATVAGYSLEVAVSAADNKMYINRLRIRKYRSSQLKMTIKKYINYAIISVHK